MLQEFKTKPFEHQLEDLREHGDLTGWAVWWEQGTGKSKLLIDTFARLVREGRVTGMLVIAPGGVDLNWITDEVPAHMPEDIVARLQCMCWRTGDAPVRRGREAERVLAGELALVTMSYDAFMTKAGKQVAWDLMRSRPILYTLDESKRIKTPNAARTKAILRSAPYAAFRRIADGTPVPNSPFDAYSQVKFVDSDFWKRELGIMTFAAFKSMFGIWVRRTLNSGGTFDECVGYRNLDLLEETLDKIRSRVLKDDVLDLPPKLYSRLPTTMNKVQATVYQQLRDEYVAWLKSGKAVTANLAIVRMLRLQQVLSGYLPTSLEEGEDGEPYEMLGNDNPRVDTVHEWAEGLNHQAIIWGRFQMDLTLICDRLGKRAVRYDGTLSERECAKSKAAFQAGDAQYFVSNPAKGGEGLTLTQAKSMAYFNNSFRLDHRLQSEDRFHRAGMEPGRPVNITDLVMPNTLDGYILGALREKRGIADQVNGDGPSGWLNHRDQPVRAAEAA